MAFNGLVNTAVTTKRGQAVKVESGERVVFTAETYSLGVIHGAVHAALDHAKEAGEGEWVFTLDMAPKPGSSKPAKPQMASGTLQELINFLFTIASERWGCNLKSLRASDTPVAAE